MQINCPLAGLNEVSSLIKIGADMFYAGLDSEIIFGPSSGLLNRRPWKAANFNLLEDFKKACFLVHEHGKKISLAINEHFYTDEQIAKIIDFIRANQGIIDGYIVADLGLMLALKKEFSDVDIVASTGAHVQNANAINFFKKIGLQKIVIPRHFSISEIKKMTDERSDLDFECFIFGGDCANVDGLCRFTHGVFDCDKSKNACSSMYNFVVSGTEIPDLDSSCASESEIATRLNNYNKIMFNNCGACALWELSRMNIRTVKIIDRETPFKQRLRYVFFIKKALSYVHLPKDKYEDLVRIFYKEIFGGHCGRRCLFKG
ncbi:U32 family peptidase [Candidatus Parcubacteria bacterium]|nr:U32 family peptidase [Patescibacteria group bacterium]MBU4309590.1 U32 family peptidase [Patescibacteria group bacterium]MBU4578022.1 U32 family peptidase [Patescibacteria group bacterium]MCG2696470.1 U32 family peptidase [Candidatus Parcubacteria bacterium]